MTKFRIWLQTTRPKTLPASLVPVLVGLSTAFKDGFFHWDTAGVTVLCALLLQVLANFVNDVYDFMKGADGKDRVGPVRAVSSGLVSERQMIRISIALAVVIFLLGMYLVIQAGPIILAVGLVSIFFAWAYTAGPFPLAYKGLGDLFVLVFFGFVSVCFTYYVQTGHISKEIFFISLPIGFISMNMLGVNNIRDLESDKRVGKRTLAVIIGIKQARLLYIFLFVLSYLVVLWFGLESNFLFLLPMSTLGMAVSLSKKIYSSRGPALNQVLAGTGKLLLIFGFILSMSMILVRYIRNGDIYG